MRIIFNLINCGLGNNGGSQTLVKSANILQLLGHEVIIIDSMDIKYTWDKLEVPHLIIENLKNVPNADVVIATGYKTVSPTLDLPNRCGIKCHWIRGWETWQIPENKIVEKILKVPTIKFVNGKRLYNKLKYFNIDSTIIRPGVDSDLYYKINSKTKKQFVIGGLYNIKHKSKNTQMILDLAKKLQFSSVSQTLLFMYGTHPKPNNKLIDHYVQNPSHKEKNKLYNSCDLWVAPTINDSLHIPPMEAMLTGCPVVGFKGDNGGMSDYLINNFNGFAVDSFSEMEDLIFSLCYNDGRRKLMEMSKNCRDYILKNIGDRKNNMENFIKILENNI